MKYHKLNVEKFVSTAVDFIQTIMNDYPDMIVDFYNTHSIRSHIVNELLIRALGESRVHVYTYDEEDDSIMNHICKKIISQHPEMNVEYMDSLVELDNHPDGSVLQSLMNGLEKCKDIQKLKDMYIFQTCIKNLFFDFTASYLFHKQPISFGTQTFSRLMIEQTVEPYYPWIAFKQKAQLQNIGFHQKPIYPLFPLTTDEVCEVFSYLFDILIPWNLMNPCMIHYKDSSLLKAFKIESQTRRGIEEMNLFSKIMEFAWQYDEDSNLQSQFFFYLGQCYGCQDIIS